jgi:hypothetical protein
MHKLRMTFPILRGAPTPLRIPLEMHWEALCGGVSRLADLFFAYLLF